MARATRRRATSSTELEAQIEEAVDGWVAVGLVEPGGWSGSPLISTPLPSGEGIWFDQAAVERVLKFFLLLRQLVGRWAGHPFRLLDWQVRWLVAPVFGIKGPDGRRVIRTVWFEIPRKNGKTTLCAGLALYLMMADREAAAEVYAAARDKAQATLVFKPARRMAAKSPAIRKKLGAVGIRTTYLEHPDTGAIFRVLSSDGDAQHGLNVHGAVIDEVHVHRNPDTVDALETGTGAREQPLVVFITTADDGKDGSIYATKRDYLEGVARRRIKDPSFYGVVFGVDQKQRGFDPFSEAAQRQANPGYGITVMAEYLAKQANEARNSPAQLNRYLRLHLNVRTKSTTAFLAPGDWARAGGMAAPISKLAGRPAWGGLDLSATTDFTAFSVIVPDGAGGFDIRRRFWLPEDRVDKLEEQLGVPLRRWAKRRLITLTEGNVVDYRQVRAGIREERDLGLRILQIGYDPWAATETVFELGEDGFDMVPVQQGYKTLSPATKELEKLVVGSTPERPLWRHGGHPVAAWMAECAEVMSDPAGNIKPVKPDRYRSAKRIDGLAADVNALACWMHRQREEAPPPAAAKAVGDDLYRPKSRLEGGGRGRIR